MTAEIQDVNLLTQFLQNFSIQKPQESPLLRRSANQPKINSYKYTLEKNINAECDYLCREYLQSKNCPSDYLQTFSDEVSTKLKQKVGNYLIDVKFSEDRKECCFDLDKIALEIPKIVENVVEIWLETKKFTKCKQIPPKFEVSYKCIKNTRRTLEDKYIVLPNFNQKYPERQFKKQYSLYCVFDGHGGSEASAYLAAQLPNELASLLTDEEDLALRETLLNLDSSFCYLSKINQFSSGSTVCVCLLSDKQLNLAYLGDSQAVMVYKDNMKCEALCKPHTADNPLEQKRVQNMGGSVELVNGIWRCQYMLSVTRSIGDCNYKPFVSADADTIQMELNGKELMIVLASDGLWDHITVDSLSTHIFDHLKKNSRATLAEYLVSLAKKEGQTDNISVIVIYLDSTGTFDEYNDKVLKTVANDLVREELDGLNNNSTSTTNKTNNSSGNSTDLSVGQACGSGRQKRPADCTPPFSLLLSSGSASSKKSGHSITNYNLNSQTILKNNIALTTPSPITNVSKLNFSCRNGLISNNSGSYSTLVRKTTPTSPLEKFDALPHLIKQNRWTVATEVDCSYLFEE